MEFRKIFFLLFFTFEYPFQASQHFHEWLEDERFVFSGPYTREIWNNDVGERICHAYDVGNFSCDNFLHCILYAAEVKKRVYAARAQANPVLTQHIDKLGSDYNLSNYIKALLISDIIEAHVFCTPHHRDTPQQQYKKRDSFPYRLQASIDQAFIYQFLQKNITKPVCPHLAGYRSRIAHAETDDIDLTKEHLPLEYQKAADAFYITFCERYFSKGL